MSGAVFKALAKYNGANDVEAQGQFDAFLAEARATFAGAALHKEILGRAKLRVETEQRALMNPVKPNPDLEAVRTAFVSIAPTGGWGSYLSNVFADEEARLRGSLAGAVNDFIRDFPAKSYLGIAARHLKFIPEKMINALCDALQVTDDIAAREEKLRILRDTIVPVLQPFLWPRTA